MKHFDDEIKNLEEQHVEQIKKLEEKKKQTANLLKKLDAENNKIHTANKTIKAAEKRKAETYLELTELLGKKKLVAETCGITVKEINRCIKILETKTHKLEPPNHRQTNPKSE